jgi:hypothetical protein
VEFVLQQADHELYRKAKRLEPPLPIDWDFAKKTQSAFTVIRPRPKLIRSYSKSAGLLLGRDGREVIGIHTNSP